MTRSAFDAQRGDVGNNLCGFGCGGVVVDENLLYIREREKLGGSDLLTLAPCSARAIAVAAPMPFNLPEPVTIAVLPFSVLAAMLADIDLET